MKRPTSASIHIPLLATLFLAACAQPKGENRVFTSDLEGITSFTVTDTNTETSASTVNEAIEAIERNDQAKLTALLADNPSLLATDLSKHGKTAESLLEVAYFSGDNTAKLSAFIDKGVPRAQVKSLLVKITERNIDPNAIGMLSGKLYLSHLNENLAREEGLRKAGLKVGSVENVKAETDPYISAGMAAGPTKESLEQLVALGDSTRQSLKQKSDLLEQYAAHLDEFGADMEKFQAKTSKDILASLQVRSTWARGEIQLRKEASEKIEAQKTKIESMLSSLQKP